MKFLRFLKNLIWHVEWLIIFGLGFIGGIMVEQSDGGELAQYSPCETCYQYFDGPRIWEGEIQIFLNTTAGLNVGQDIQWAIEYINLYADVPLEYMGYSSLAPLDYYDSSRRGIALISWDELGATTTGTVNGNASIWWNWHASGHINYGQAKLDYGLTETCRKGTILHEFIHLLGIAHSDEQHSIMYATPYNSCSYQATLRVDDIEAIQSLYPPRQMKQAPIASPETGCIYIPEIDVEGYSYQVELCNIAEGQIKSLVAN